MADGFLGELLDSRLAIVMGKGGCGKTTISSTIAVAAAETGLRVALVEMGFDEHIHKLLAPESQPVGYAGRVLRPGLWVCRIDPFDALAEYLGLQIGLRSLVERSLKLPAFQQLLSAAPGWRELVILGKIWHLESQREANGRPRFDLIVVDAPSTGHGLPFLDVPSVVQSAVRAGPLHRRAADVEALICDPKRTQVVPVSLAEELPVRETEELVARIRDHLHMAVKGVVINGVMRRPFRPEHDDIGQRLGKLPNETRFGALPTVAELAQCCDEQISRYRMNRHYIAETARTTGLPIFTLPRLREGVRGPADLLDLSRELCAESALDGHARSTYEGAPP